jgi:hypothetical protein
VILHERWENNVILPLCEIVGSVSNLRAMKKHKPNAKKSCMASVRFREPREFNEMATKNNKALTNEAYYVSAADLADKIVVLMQQGLDPLFLSTSTWALVQASQCQAVN